MRSLILCAALSIAAGSAVAGTLSIDFIGGTQYRTTPEDGENSLTLPPFDEPFLFSVAKLSAPAFDFVGMPSAWNSGPFADDVVKNPRKATLLSRPDGHLGGYYEGLYTIRVRPNFVSVIGDLWDGDDVLFLTDTSIVEDHNQNLFAYESFGYWTATYTPDGERDGRAFTTAPPTDVAAVPLPAGAPLLALGLAGIGALVRRSRRTA